MKIVVCLVLCYFLMVSCELSCSHQMAGRLKFLLYRKRMMNNNSDLPKSELPLAQFFIKQREIIEAERPLCEIGVFVLPIISPLVPFYDWISLVPSVQEIFSFQARNCRIYTLKPDCSGFGTLGYVGAVSFIQSFLRG